MAGCVVWVCRRTHALRGASDVARRLCAPQKYIDLFCTWWSLQGRSATALKALNDSIAGADAGLDKKQCVRVAERRPAGPTQPDAFGLLTDAGTALRLRRFQLRIQLLERLGSGWAHVATLERQWLLRRFPEVPMVQC
jgi:hypothetical protein